MRPFSSAAKGRSFRELLQELEHSGALFDYHEENHIKECCEGEGVAQNVSEAAENLGAGR